MTDTTKPLTADEIANLAALYRPYNDGEAKSIKRLIATIEQQDEQIEKLRRALLAVRSINSCTDHRNAARSEILRITEEALAATEQK